MERIFNLEAVDKIGEQVTLCGWVNARRDMGKVIFLDLRDKSGLIQIVCHAKAAVAVAEKIRPEFVLKIKGKVQSRDAKNENPKLATGKVEIYAEEVEILSEAKTPPFELDKDTAGINEEMRLKYRYLDLRSERMHKNMVLRHRTVKFIRDYLDKEGFLEIETPYLTKGTPEGAREFIVPSRLHAGNFYVLPQSPQQFKQLLMVGGVERYFQIARCFRDEDQRGDRQPEFTQMDLEMSFVEREDVMRINEEMMIALLKVVSPEKKIQEIPFPRMSYDEAMKKYKSDKPDLRKDKNDPNLLAFCWVIDFPFFEKADNGGWTFTHNPFSAPMPEHMDDLMAKKNVGKILTTQYDLVMNGFEAGGGSIRNHNPEALRKVFEIMGFEEKQINAQFGHMLEAFSYGAPPHGGIAWGLDRVVMILANEPNVREVMVFPKTGDARDPMMDAPSELPEKALREVHIKVIK